MLDKNSKKILKYMNDCFDNGKNITFLEIASHFDMQVQDLKIIFDYLIENGYYIIFDDTNTCIDWDSKYNGVPSIKCRTYFKKQRNDKLINFFKYSFFNVFMPILISFTTTLITIMLTQSQ